MALVSTISPCYGMKRYLKLFLQELPQQTAFIDIEVVLDHNDPDEEEVQWVKDFQAQYPDRLVHLITRPVAPVGTSMNKCISVSSGKYLAVWNIDDLRTPDSIQKQIDILESNESCDVAFGSFVVVNSPGLRAGSLLDHTRFTPGHSELTRGMVLGPFFMFRKTVLEKVGLFDEQLVSGADFDFAVRLGANNSNIICADGILGYYLNEGMGASTNGSEKQPVERTVVELRYGIFDKIESRWLEKAKLYKVDQLLINGNWIPVSKYIKNYEQFVILNSNKQ